MPAQSITRFFLVLSSFLLLPSSAQGDSLTEYPAVFSMKERAQKQDAWLRERLDTIVPALMRERGVDMWVLIAREYNEDPVVKTMLPATWLGARRRTILMFYDNGTDVERLAVSRYAVGDFFPAAWSPEDEPNQWKKTANLIAARNPQKIALNVSETFPLADGLSSSQHTDLLANLSPELRERIVYDPAMAIGWLERRIPAEMATYPHVMQLAHAIIKEGLSSAVIKPGVTKPADVSWWFRDKIRQLGVVAWFHPSVSVQRQTLNDKGQKMTELFDPEKDNIIRPGDLIHVDFGITYMGLNTDTQQHAYVLKPGETDAPEGIQAALTTGNRLQDILTDNFKTGASGNSVLAETRRQAIEEDIDPSIYTHPIGYHGHGAGATIGLWDMQGSVPERGDYPVVPNTAWSIELSALVPIPEWGGQVIRIMLEEDAFFDGTSVNYINGRQTQLHLIPGTPN